MPKYATTDLAISRKWYCPSSACCISQDDPIVLFEHKGLYDIKGSVPDTDDVTPLNKGEVARQGEDVTVVTFSKMRYLALEAAESLEAQEISVEVLDARCMSPLDESLILSSVQKTKRLIVVDEDSPRCGMAADVVAMVASKGYHFLESAPKLLTPPHTPIPFAPTLEDFYLPNSKTLIEMIHAMVPAKTRL